MRQENISDLYRGNLRHEEMKLCGKSAAEPEKGPNAALINTWRLITRHSSLEQCCSVPFVEEFHLFPVLEGALPVLLCPIPAYHTLQFSPGDAL